MKGCAMLPSHHGNAAHILVCVLLTLSLLSTPTHAQDLPKRTPSPCSLAQSLNAVHTSFIKMSEVVQGADITVVRLHHTSRHAPYERIEHAWVYVNDHNDPLLDHLTNLQISLDAAPKNAKKQAANDLILAYQSAFDQLFQYMHLIISYERTENALSKYYSRRAKGYIQWGSGGNFGVVGDVTRTGGDNATRDILTEKSTLFTDAVLSVKLPEYRYARFCHTAFPDDISMLVRQPTP